MQKNIQKHNMTFTPYKQIEQQQNSFTPASDILIKKYQAEDQAKNNTLQNAGFTSLPLLDLLKGAVKGVAETANNINKSAEPVMNAIDKPINKVAQFLTGSSDETAKKALESNTQQRVADQAKIDELAQTHNTAQDFGKGIEKVAEFAIPETKALKGVEALNLGKIATGAVKALTSFGTTAGVSKLQGADNTQAGEMGVASAVIPPVLSGAFKVLGSTLKGTAGALSGKGTKAIEAILDNPKEALKGMSQEGIDTLKQNAQKIQELGSSYYNKAKNEFATTLDTIKSKVKNIDSKAITQKLQDTLDENNISLTTTKKGIIKSVDLSGFAGDNKALLQKTFDLIKGKANDTVQGVEDIAQIINKQKLNTNNIEMKTILGKMANAYRSAYVDQLNKLGLTKEAKIAETYAKAHDKLDTFDSLFGTESRSKIFKESTLNDIMNKVKNLTAGDKTIQGAAIDNIGGDVKAILAKETGRQMKENITKAEATIGDTIGKMVQAALPSKTVGQVTAGVGIVKDKLQPIIDYITSHEGIKTGAKQALINYVNSFLSSE